MSDLLMDIDLDFFFAPPMYHPGESHPERFKPWLSPQDFLKYLAAAGIKMPPVEAAGMEDHRQAYFCWKRAGCRNAIVVHFDAHSDCYGSFPEIVHCGNFIRKALNEGIVRRIVWVLPAWFYHNPGHPVASDALNSLKRGAYRPLPLKVVSFTELPAASGLSFSGVAPRMVTLALSTSYVPESAFESHFVPLAGAFGISHSGVPSVA
ncbi:MAG TPA: hypothetical protein GX506_02870 [Firmicutes bacterium]|nr:hypothetical protein [Bacillota bacterium]